MRHYQVKVSEYGGLMLRAPDEPEIVGIRWRLNQYGQRNTSGYFGQAILFSSRADPGFNTDIDYRLPDGDGFAYFTGKMPALTGTWQWVEGERAPRDDIWHDLEKPDAPPEPLPNGVRPVAPRRVMAIDFWLLDDDVPVPSGGSVDRLIVVSTPMGKWEGHVPFDAPVGAVIDLVAKGAGVSRADYLELAPWAGPTLDPSTRINAYPECKYWALIATGQAV